MQKWVREILYLKYSTQLKNHRDAALKYLHFKQLRLLGKDGLL